MEVPLTKKEKRALGKEQKRKEREKSQLVSKIKTITIALIVVSVLALGGYKFVNWIKTPQDESLQEVVQVAENEWIKGNVNALITIIEYSDFQCPACASYAPVMKRLSQEFPDKLRIIYRHFPLVSVHANAVEAARAAEAAGLQGKFWEMHDMLFEKQDEWSKDGSPKDKFTSYAQELELDEEKFLADYESKAIEEKVDQDLASANQLRLNSTPSFFLDGEKISPGGYDEFKALVEEKVNRSE